MPAEQIEARAEAPVSRPDSGSLNDYRTETPSTDRDTTSARTERDDYMSSHRFSRAEEIFEGSATTSGSTARGSAVDGPTSGTTAGSAEATRLGTAADSARLENASFRPPAMSADRMDPRFRDSYYPPIAPAERERRAALTPEKPAEVTADRPTAPHSFGEMPATAPTRPAGDSSPRSVEKGPDGSERVTTFDKDGRASSVEVTGRDASGGSFTHKGRYIDGKLYLQELKTKDSQGRDVLDYQSSDTSQSRTDYVDGKKTQWNTSSRSGDAETGFKWSLQNRTYEADGTTIAGGQDKTMRYDSSGRLVMESSAERAPGGTHDLSRSTTKYGSGKAFERESEAMDDKGNVVSKLKETSTTKGELSSVYEQTLHDGSRLRIDDNAHASENFIIEKDGTIHGTHYDKATGDIRYSTVKDGKRVPAEDPAIKQRRFPSDA